MVQNTAAPAAPGGGRFIVIHLFYYTSGFGWARLIVTTFYENFLLETAWECGVVMWNVIHVGILNLTCKEVILVKIIFICKKVVCYVSLELLCCYCALNGYGTHSWLAAAKLLMTSLNSELDKNNPYLWHYYIFCKWYIL